MCEVAASGCRVSKSIHKVDVSTCKFHKSMSKVVKSMCENHVSACRVAVSRREVVVSTCKDGVSINKIYLSNDNINNINAKIGVGNFRDDFSGGVIRFRPVDVGFDGRRTVRAGSGPLSSSYFPVIL